MHPRNLLALWLVFFLSVPPALSAPCSDGPSPECPAGSRAEQPWWDPGWLFRAPITFDHTNNTTDLKEYQVLLNISYDSDMKADFSDMRFAQQAGPSILSLPYWIESKEDGKKAKVWVNVSYMTGGNTTDIYLYYGNPSALSESNGAATFLLFDGFDGIGLDTSMWNEPHSNNAGTSASVSAGMLDFNVLNGYKWTGGCVISKVALPAADYVVESRLKFTDFWQSAYGAYAGFTNSTSYDDTNYGKPAKLVSARLYDYTKLGTYLSLTADDIGSMTGSTQITVRNLWYKMKTVYTPDVYAKGVWTQLESPFSEQSLEISGSKGIPPTYLTCGIGDYSTSEHTYFDYIFLHKYTSPEPTYSIGKEERPFSYRSMGFFPAQPSAGDKVAVNATYTNPLSVTIPINVSFSIGDELNSSEPLIQKNLLLAPSGDTVVPMTWASKGGKHRIWACANGCQAGHVDIDVNWPPTLESVRDQVLYQGSEFQLQLNASDRDGDPLEWKVDSSLVDFTITSNCTADISWVPTNEDVGVHKVNISIKDQHGCSASQVVSLAVRNVNDPPLLEAIPSLSAVEHQELRYQAKASDPDLKYGDELTFSDDTDMFDIDVKTGEFSFTPAEEQVGKHSVKVAVTDAEGAQASRKFYITVANVNDPPEIGPIERQAAWQGRVFRLQVNATDPDQKSDPGEKLRYSDDSAYINISADTGLISFTPTNDELGVYEATVTVTDKAGLTASAPLTITVLNVNDPPAIDPIPDLEASEDVAFYLQANAQDPDLKWGLDNLTFSDNTDLFAIDPKSGVMTFTPKATQAGSHRITVTVKDESGASASVSFQLTVIHVNHPPYNVLIRSPKDGTKMTEGTGVFLEGTAKDPDAGDELEFSWLDNNAPAGMGKNISVVLKPGKHVIRLEVSDGLVTVGSDVTVEVSQKEKVTVAEGSSWVGMAAVALSVIVGSVLAVGFVATRKRRRAKATPLPQEGAPAAYPAPEDPAAMSLAQDSNAVAKAESAPAPPQAPAPNGAQSMLETRNLIDSSMEAIALFQGEHPEKTVEVAAALESLDIARQLLEDGDYEEALQFARGVADNVQKLGESDGPREIEEAARPTPQHACPGCGEPMEPQWTACPVCGNKR